MKELIIIWKETFLREPVTMTHLTILLTSRERSPATMFVQHGWGIGWGGHLAHAESFPWNWAKQILVQSQVVSQMATFCHAEVT